MSRLLNTTTQSVCKPLIGYCPIDDLWSPYGQSRWEAYHNMLQSHDDKKGGAGYWYGQTYYNLQDAAKCVNHFRDMKHSIHPSTRLPKFRMHYISGTPDVVEITCLNMYQEVLCNSWRAPASKEWPEQLSVFGHNFPWIGHEVHSLAQCLDEREEQQKKMQYAYFSPTMKSHCEKHDTKGWACTLCGGLKKMDAGHWYGKEHMKRMANKKCLDEWHWPVYAWYWDGQQWTDIYDPTRAAEIHQQYGSIWQGHDDDESPSQQEEKKPSPEDLYEPWQVWSDSMKFNSKEVDGTWVCSFCHTKSKPSRMCLGHWLSSKKHDEKLASGQVYDSEGYQVFAWEWVNDRWVDVYDENAAKQVRDQYKQQYQKTGKPSE